MFKLSLAFSAALVAGQVSLQTYCDALAMQCPGHSMNSSVCQTAMFGTPGMVNSLNELDQDSLECRYNYLTNSTYNMSSTACQYAGPTGGGRCGVILGTACRVINTICSTEITSPFASVSDCTANTAAGLKSREFQWGSKYGANANPEDSLECRVYHAVAGLITGNTTLHCAHVTGDVTDTANNVCNAKVSPNANHYCDIIQRNCPVTATSNIGQFAMDAQCRVVAAGYPTSTGDDARPVNQHTLGCRQYHAQAAQGNSQVHCEHGGPSGAGQCGMRQEAWASILKAAPCLDPHVDMFVTSVKNSTVVDMLIPTGVVAGSSYSTTFDVSGNNQICRIYHLGVASTLPFGATGHCQHGAVSGGGACGTIVANLCGLINLACGFGTNASWQFADSTACTNGLTSSATNNITIGTTNPQDTTMNTHECRFYHAGVAASYLPGAMNGGAANAMAMRTLHCGHVLQKANPGGCGATTGSSPTAAPGSPTTRASSASTVSVLASGFVLAVSVFSL